MNRRIRRLTRRSEMLVAQINNMQDDRTRQRFLMGLLFDNQIRLGFLWDMHRSREAAHRMKDWHEGVPASFHKEYKQLHNADLRLECWSDPERAGTFFGIMSRRDRKVST